jgi:sugar/nucleoside kinase (ribokinase family)
MARVLQDLLAAKDPAFMTAIHHLEKATGHAGVDTRLIGDIIARSHEVMRTLGLDPADTTARELYNALRSRAKDEGLFADTGFVGLVLDGEVISFNANDVLHNHTREYEERTLDAMRQGLAQEIVDRYYQHPRTDGRVVEQFAADAGLAVVASSVAVNDAADVSLAPSILSVGDIFSDAFIKLNEDYARIDTDPDGSKRLSLPFGSKPPYDSVEIVQAVGPSPNAAVSFARLGLRSSLMAFLGDDEPGRNSLDYLHSEQIDTTPMSVQTGINSNYYYVLRYGADRTILVRNEDYDYTWHAPQTAPDWVYLSLISQSSWQLHEDLLAYLQEHPNTKLAFQPGTFHFEWGAEKLARVYARSHIVVMNREEAVDVTGKSYDSLRELADGLHALGPKIVVITDGPSGSYASYDGKLVTIPNYPDPAPPVDRTGAGDAFASTIVAALAHGESMDAALTWAPINSMSVVQKLGAQAGLLRKNEIKRYLQTAPADYRPEELQ